MLEFYWRQHNRVTDSNRTDCEQNDCNHDGADPVHRPKTNGPEGLPPRLVHGQTPNEPKPVEGRGPEVLPFSHSERRGWTGSGNQVRDSASRASHPQWPTGHHSQRVRCQQCGAERLPLVRTERRALAGRAHFEAKRDKFPLRSEFFYIQF